MESPLFRAALSRRIIHMMHFDAAIIGAGPAGSAAAIALAARGWHVVLLEKQTFPRDKLCGEFISPEGLADLEALGVRSALEEVQPPLIRRTRITFASGHTLNSQFDSPGWGLSRKLFDDVLFRQASAKGATCLEGIHIRKITGSLRGGFRVFGASSNGVTETFEARGVLVATGRWSNIPKEAPGNRGSFFSEKQRLGIKAHFRGEVDLQEAVELHFFDRGYCGLNPVEGNEINLCALVTPEMAAPFGKNYEAMLTAAFETNSELRQRLRQLTRVSDFITTSPVVFGRRRTIAGDMFLVGDAAGFLDPFSGDGISSAIRSALLAGEAVEQFLTGKVSAEEAMRRYQSAYDKEFKGRFFFARLIRQALSTHTIPILFSHLQTRLPAVGQWLVRRTRGAIIQATARSSARPFLG